MEPCRATQHTHRSINGGNFVKLPLPKQTGKKNVIRQFVDQYGLVYFGHVDQHDDDHQVIRGMTVSHSHRDEHYSVGSYESYDISFVERTDSIKNPKTDKVQHHTWHILQIDLHNTVDLPHIFIGLHTHSESFYRQLFTKYSHLRPLPIGTLRQYDPTFVSQYRVYGHPSEHLEIERLLHDTVDKVFVQHFGSLAIELHDGALYVYSESRALHVPLLEAMIKNGVWLARHIDEIAKQL